jgi:2-keto-4-pentenoate hydratase
VTHDNTHTASTLADAMRTLLARRDEDRRAGVAPVGWKVGLNQRALQEHFGLDGPVVGYLSEATVVAPGTAVSLEGWARPALEVEVAVRVGVGGGPAFVAPALELVDLDPAVTELGAMVAGNIFHRGVVFGEDVDLALAEGPGAVHVSVTGNDARLHAHGALQDAPAATVDLVRSYLATHGAALSAGDRIIGGTMVAPLALEPGDKVTVDFGALGHLAISFT